MTVLQLDHLSVRRGGRSVVHDVSIVVPAGQITGLLGPNGAGKSSIALAIAGLLPGTGRITVDGRSVGGRSPARMRACGVATVPEGRRILMDLTVADNLVAATYGRPKSDLSEAQVRTRDLFPELDKRWSQQAKNLSGGEQQMLALAMALAAKPDILVIDELSLGLAPIVVRRLIPTVQHVADSGVGVLLIEQFTHVVLALATDVHVLDRGRLTYSGAKSMLRDGRDVLGSAYLQSP